ncbi:MAG: transcription elongation factor GreA [Firmicutes bacterium ADurb.Bin419]|nr:MAG: transcription elongation factor GreA [Firmicutes bacterium ADurb.Bin419]
MCKNLLSKKVYDYLTWHVDKIEKEQELLFKKLYADETLESMNFEEFFNEYLNNIKDYLNTVSVGTGGKNSCPLVIIGSIVDVYDSDDMEDYQYRIVLPYSNQQDMSIDCASCLSPLGRSLLLKKEKENVSIQIPTGELHYLVKQITIPDIKTVNKLSGTISPALGTIRNINM